MTHPAPRPQVTVVVPVRDGRPMLPGLLAALQRQTVGPEAFEVLLADDGSVDGACAGLADGALRLTVLAGPPRTSYAARNRAAAFAASPVLAFTDADCRPEPDWLERGLAALEGADVVAGVVHFDIEGQVGVWGLLDMDVFLDQERQVRNNAAATANLFVPRELFERLGGFDADLPSNGDHDFVGRCVDAGARLAFAGGAGVLHPVRDGRREFVAKYWRTNRAYGARMARAGRSTQALKLLVPLWRPWRERHAAGRPLGLDRRRLARSRVRPGPRQRVTALLLMYLVLPYLAAAARLAGWGEGRRLRPVAKGRTALEVTA